MPGAKTGASGHLTLPSVEKLLYLPHNANMVDKENAPFGGRTTWRLFHAGDARVRAGLYGICSWWIRVPGNSPKL